MLKHYLITLTFPLFLIYALFVLLIWPFLWFAPEVRKRLIISLFGWLEAMQRSARKLAGQDK